MNPGIDQKEVTHMAKSFQNGVYLYQFRKKIAQRSLMPSVLTREIARQFKEVYFGGNWTAVDLTKTLSNVSWQQATAKVDSFNTITALVYHIGYYVNILANALSGGTLSGSDKYSYNHPPVASATDWENLLAVNREAAEKLITLIEEMPEEKLWETFFDQKYGNYFRNLHGLIEHTHYHLGQIVLLKKLLASSGLS
jgi:uncharacterized damage-inducible protein DinB